jgi:transposase
VTVQSCPVKKEVKKFFKSQKRVIFAANINSSLTRNQARIQELECQLVAKAQLIEELSTQLSLLEAKNAMLESELSLYRTRKNSSNSSIPPSCDPYRIKRTESLRQRSGRKPGGQPGHDGCTLEAVSEPTEVILHQPNYCHCCGGDLSGIPAEFIGKRQVIDIPPITPVVTEHQIYGKRCHCGHLTEMEYPVEAHSPVCYGSRLTGLTAYFHARRYIPFERMRELYGDILGLSISSGSLVKMVESFAHKSQSVYEKIRRRVFSSPVVGADETGVNINGKNRWVWVFQTPEVTCIHAGLSRSKKVIDQLFPQGFPRSIPVHDCWRSYFSVQTQGHQICTAHLLRELKYLDKLYPRQQWTTDFTGLLHRALELKKTPATEDDPESLHQRSILEEQVDQMLAQTIDSRHKKLIVFKERIQKYRNYLFLFLYHLEVPPDNNASERAVRTYKVKQKVSGLFRTEQGANAFAVIRSVIDTTIKNGKNVWEALALIPVSAVNFQDSG